MYKFRSVSHTHAQHFTNLKVFGDYFFFSSLKHRFAYAMDYDVPSQLWSHIHDETYASHFPLI